MLNPLRSEIEQIIFPDEASVVTMYESLNQSLRVIQLEEANPTADSPDIIQRNKEFITTTLAYETMYQSGLDLSELIAITQ